MLRPMGDAARTHGPGPFRADDLPEGAPYELSAGHAIFCAPSGGRHARAAVAGATALSTDPAVDAPGIEPSYRIDARTLRSPEVAIGNVPDVPGHVAGAPPLAVEYASVGQDEAELAAKIDELLQAGTRWVWVVRLRGPRRVEVHEPGRPMTTIEAGGVLRAPGVLRNDVPVAALFDLEAANAAALRNLLQRHGFESVEAIRRGGIEEGALAHARSALRRVMDLRGLDRSAAFDARVDSEADVHVLDRWHDRAMTARSSADVLD